jgi:hypothetical protein
MRLNDAVRRALRTFVQAFTGSILTSGVLGAVADGAAVDLSIFQKTGVSALAAGVIALLTYVQNALEDNGAIPAVLKAQASSGAEPATIDPAV